MDLKDAAAVICALSPVKSREGGMVLFDTPNITSIRVAKFEVRQGGAVVRGLRARVRWSIVCGVCVCVCVCVCECVRA